jgi:hypothetical protein
MTNSVVFVTVVLTLERAPPGPKGSRQSSKTDTKQSSPSDKRKSKTTTSAVGGGDVASGSFLNKKRQSVKLAEKIDITHDTRLFRFALPAKDMALGLPTGMCTCVRICMYIYVCMYVCIYICINVCMYVCMYAYISILYVFIYLFIGMY